jgi:LmbE family N-acetylglucosaminyl deacetylase
MRAFLERNFKRYRIFALIAILIIELLVLAAQYFTHPLLSFWQRTQLSKSSDRILILAPHPDDEILGCGGIIQNAVRMNIPLKIVFLTYGDNNEWSFLIYRKHLVFMPKAVQTMGLIRREEAIEASQVMGLSPDHLIFLGYPDFKTLNIWYSHWGNQPAAKSMLTSVRAVPYANAFRPGAPYKGEDVLQDLKTIILDFKPTKIFVSHPADFNADHKALYLFTRVALWDLKDKIRAALNPYLIHYKNWPLPKGRHFESQRYPPALYRKKIAWKINVLSQEEIAINYLAIQKHRSQYKSTAGYLVSFIRSPELFGDFSDIVVDPETKNILLPITREKDLRSSSEKFSNDENNSMVGIEERSAYIENNDLILTIGLSRPLGKAAGLSLYAFGYRQDKPFQDMPKIRIRFGMIEHKIFDQTHQLTHSRVFVKRKARELIVSIPLTLLGNPDKILTSANTYLGAVPLDSTPWRILEISKPDYANAAR